MSALVVSIHKGSAKLGDAIIIIIIIMVITKIDPLVNSIWPPSLFLENDIGLFATQSTLVTFFAN